MMKVLFAEDDDLTVHEVKAVLLEEGFEVIIAKDGGETLDKYYQTQPDVIILDVDMPVYNGFDVLQRIRVVDQQTPVVIYSSLRDEAHIMQGFANGANVYLLKDYTPAAMVAQVKRCLDKMPDGVITLAGGVSYDIARDLLIIGDRTEKLSKLESKIFLILCKNRNKLTPRKLLLTIGWRTDDSGNHLQLNKIINKLRNVLKVTDKVSITTDKGNGYWLITG